jgi:hypothetical protein
MLLLPAFFSKKSTGNQKHNFGITNKSQKDNKMTAKINSIALI